MVGRRIPRRTRRTGYSGGVESRRKGRSSPCQTSWHAFGAVNRPIRTLTRKLGPEVLSGGLANRGLDALAVALAGSLDAVAVSGLPHGFVALKASAQPTRDRGERACHPGQGHVVADVGVVTECLPQCPGVYYHRSRADGERKQRRIQRRRSE